MDDATFSSIVEQYADFAYNLAYRMVGNSADAEDVVQDAFLSAYRAKDRFRGGSQPTTWLYRIVMNAALMKLRKEKRSRQRTVTSSDEIEVVDWSPGPESQVLNDELKEKLEESIGLLSDDLRTAVVLRDVQELSIEEAAQVVGVSVAAFKARLHRSRVALRSYLSTYVRTSRSP